MSAILKAGASCKKPFAPAVFQMQDLAGEAQALVEAARAEAADIVADARRTSAEMSRRAAETGHRKGYDKGLAEGRKKGYDTAFDEARRKFQTEQANLVSVLKATLDQISGQRVGLLNEAEKDLLQFAFEVARKIVHNIGRLNRDVAVHNLKSALALVMTKSDFVLKLHPDDVVALKRFAEDFGGSMSLPHITFTEDPSTDPGGVVLLTDTGKVDATLDGQLRQIISALFADPVEESGD